MSGNAVTWNHLGEVVRLQQKIQGTIAGIKDMIKTFDRIKQDILDDPTLKANLKEALKVHPDVSIESVVADYQKLKALGQYLIDNDFIET